MIWFSALWSLCSFVLCTLFNVLCWTLSKSWEFRALCSMHALTQPLFTLCYSCTLSPGAVFSSLYLPRRAELNKRLWNGIQYAFKPEFWFLSRFFTAAVPYFMSPSAINPIIFVFCSIWFFKYYWIRFSDHHERFAFLDLLSSDKRINVIFCLD